MAKGRRFNPPLDQDGRWFPHIGLPQKTPESITRATLKEPRSPRASRQAEEKLPPIYKIREKQAVHHSFPFSVHDNRHSFANSGFYLDSVSISLRVTNRMAGDNRALGFRRRGEDRGLTSKLEQGQSLMLGYKKKKCGKLPKFHPAFEVCPSF
ncbi:testis expressed 36 [Phyllostomus discolor]|uniref:Testis expressed 36 n=1 Tax=Phyllostomus discolor TaxID=89673 RepID=A0A834AJ74_9CHIR|nr:testis expressed 36 [Phyllostomus discolor]